jgi:hypothetical protein
MRWWWKPLPPRKPLDFLEVANLSVQEIDQVLDKLRVLFRTPADEQDEIYRKLGHNTSTFLACMLAMSVEVSARMLVCDAGENISNMGEGRETILRNIRAAYLVCLDQMAQTKVEIPDYPPEL